MTTVDLSALPPPEVIAGLSFVATRERWGSSLAGIDVDLAASLVPGDVGTELIAIGAYRDLHVAARTNDAARQRFLAEAYGAGLDELGRVMGVIRLVDEADDDYRARIHAAQRSKGTGSQNRYKEIAEGSSPFVLHANAAKTGTSQMSVYWTPTFDSTPSERLAAGFAVQFAINNNDSEGFEVRMMTDEVVDTIVGTESLYALTAHLHIAPGPDPGEVLSRATEAVTSLADKSLRGAGIPVPRSELMSALHVTGVAKVDLASPAVDLAAIVNTYHEASSITVTHETADWLL